MEGRERRDRGRKGECHSTMKSGIEKERREEDGESHVGGNYPMLKPYKIGWITQGGTDFIIIKAWHGNYRHS